MPKRPKQHVIDECAQRIFRAAMPPEWVINPLDNDYCKDYLVEVTAGAAVTGNVFIVQLKGQQSPRVNPVNNTFGVPIKRDHLRYYVEEFRLPIFIVGVDVGRNSAFFEFAQGQVERDPNLIGNRRDGKITFRVSRDNRLEDIPRLLRDLDSAWTLMRNKYPGSVASAAQYRTNLLEKLDSRFRYDVAYVDGKESVTVHPNQPVEFTLKIKGDKDVVNTKIDEFLDLGNPLESEAGVELHVEGLPALGSNARKLLRVVQIPRRPVEVLLYAKDGQGARVYSPEFRGNLEGGRKRQTFHGELSDCPLSLDFVLEQVADGRRKLQLQWHFHTKVWVGRRLVVLPWLEQMWALVHSVSGAHTNLGLVIRSQGNDVVDVDVPRPEAAWPVSDCYPYLDLLRRARDLCRVLDLDPAIPQEWTDEDLNDVEELHALVTTGVYHFPRSAELSFISSRLTTNREDILNGKGALRVQHEKSTYRFLGVSFDFSETYLELRGWRLARLSDIVEEGASRTKVELLDFEKTRVWPRFLPAVPTSGS